MSIRSLFQTKEKPSSALTLAMIQDEAAMIYDGYLSAEAELFLCEAQSIDEVVKGRNYITALALTCYDYCVDGRVPTSGERFDRDWSRLAQFVLKSMINCEFQSTPFPSAMTQMLRMGEVRAKLDTDTLEGIEGRLPTAISNGACGYLSLFEMADLGQMHSKSVRNAAQAGTEDRLETIKVGSKTMVESNEALRWLSNRRNFLPSYTPL